MQHKNKLEYLLGFDGYVRIVACASNQLTKNRMSQMEIRRIFRVHTNQAIGYTRC